ncbi:MAG: tetratricopeptide repeat protein [bacterium]
MSMSPFFKEIGPGPIGPRPDENVTPLWFKIAWLVGVVLVVGAVGAGFYLLTGPGDVPPPLVADPQQKSDIDGKSGGTIRATNSESLKKGASDVNSTTLAQARKVKSKIIPPEEVAIDPNAPAAGPWIKHHYAGLGFMERYEYDRAVAEFRKVIELEPAWLSAKINLAIARLNQTGTESESAKNSRTGEPAKSNFDEALELLDSVIAQEPANLHARFSRGVILEYVGRLAEAQKDFRVVAVKDPGDGHAWYKVGSTLTSNEDPSQPAGPDQAQELIEIYERALECNPYLVPALYRLQMAYAMAGDRAQQNATIERWTSSIQK